MVDEVKTSFYIRKDILQAAKQRALDEETSLKEILTRYIIEGLKRDEEDHEQTKLELKKWLIKIMFIKIELVGK